MITLPKLPVSGSESEENDEEGGLLLRRLWYADRTEVLIPRPLNWIVLEAVLAPLNWLKLGPLVEPAGECLLSRMKIILPFPEPRISSVVSPAEASYPSLKVDPTARATLELMFTLPEGFADSLGCCAEEIDDPENLEAASTS